MDYGPQKLADIRALGPANIVISTDLGQPGRVNYAQAFHTAMAVLAKSGFSQAQIVISTDLAQPGRVNFAQAFQTAMAVLARSGFSQAEIDMIAKQNPARLLGLK